jgi:hypothetical protein
MKRTIQALLALVVALGVVLAVPSAANADYAGCRLTADYLPGDVSNGLTFSQIDEPGAWFSPRRRAGTCGRLWVTYTGTYNGPSCVHVKARTYNENGTLRVETAWITYSRIGETHNARRGPIDAGRLYRIIIRNCNPDYRRLYSTGLFKPGFRLNAQ